MRNQKRGLNHSIDWLRLSKAVKVRVTNPEGRPIFIESLAFENAKLECKKVLGTLKVITAPIDE